MSGMTVSQLRDALMDFPGELPVIMRTYHKADVCPIVEVEMRTLAIATDIMPPNLWADERRW